jgi:hypothetical protein
VGEYLLFNPYKVCWLSEYNGHWNYIKTTTNIPKRQTGGAYNYLGQSFLHFQTAEARVSYVLGEFYWRIQVGEICEVADFVSPPLILSMERSETEVTWSIGEYIEPETLWEAFQLKTSIPPKIGIALNQPSKLVGLSPQLWKWWGVFFLVALLLQVIFLLLSANKLIIQDAFAFHLADKEKARITPVFELTGRPSNVVIRSKATVDNSWIYLNLALINEETGNGYNFGRETVTTWKRRRKVLGRREASAPCCGEAGRYYRVSNLKRRHERTQYRFTGTSLAGPSFS